MTTSFRHNYHHQAISQKLQKAGTYSAKGRYIQCKGPVHTVQKAGTYSAKGRYIQCKRPVHTVQKAGTYSAKSSISM